MIHGADDLDLSALRVTSVPRPAYRISRKLGPGYQSSMGHLMNGPQLSRTPQLPLHKDPSVRMHSRAQNERDKNPGPIPASWWIERLPRRNCPTNKEFRPHLH